MPIIIEALKQFGGSARMRDISRYVWENYRQELEQSGEFLFVWQYELRWAGDALVKEKKMKKGPPDGVWHLT